MITLLSDDAIRVTLIHVTTVAESLIFFRGQIGFMRARGIDCIAVTSPGEHARTFSEKEGVPVVTIEMSRRITPLRDLRALWRLWRVIRQESPQIVHSHTPKGGLLGMIAAWLAGVKVRIYHMRGLPFVEEVGVRRQLLRLAERTSCALAGQVLCVSHSLRDLAIREGLCRPDKIKVLRAGSGNGVDASKFDPRALPAGARAETRRRFGIADADIVVGFVGRLVRDKGLVELVRAWMEIRGENPLAHLLMVGPFEPQDPLPPDVEAVLRTNPRIHLAGLDWNTPPLFAAMDVLVLPTYREGFPNVLLEAAAMEIPVVATTVPGCIDAVDDGTTGTLVSAKDAVSLADAIRRYLDSPELRLAHGKAARRRVLKDFQRERIWESLHWEYETHLRRAGFAPLPGQGAVAAEGRSGV